MKKGLMMLVAGIFCIVLGGFLISGCLLEKLNVSVDKVDTEYDGAGVLLSPTQ